MVDIVQEPEPEVIDLATAPVIDLATPVVVDLEPTSTTVDASNAQFAFRDTRDKLHQVQRGQKKIFCPT